VLHELLTGAQVFEGDSVYAIARAIELDEVAPPSATAGTLPPGLDHAVMRGLDRDLDRRWQSADELARALDQVVAAAEGESLGEYAARQLGDEHRRHREWLRSVLEPAGSQGSRAGRPSGIMTAPARAAILDDVPTLDGTRPGRGRRRAVVAGLAAVVAAGGVALWVASEGGTRASKLGVLEGESRGSEPGPRGTGDAAEEGGVERVIAFDAGAVALPPTAGSDEADTTPVRESPRKTRRASQSRKPRPGARSRSGTGTGTISGSGPGSGSVPGSGSASEQGSGSGSAPIGAGTITLRTQPGTQWAEVRIDGKDVGDTPMKREIAAGSHDIEFVRPDKDEVRYRRTVHVAAGQHVEVVAP